MHNHSSKQIITTDEAPAAIGPYSQAVVSGGLVYVSGQIPLDPATGEIAGTDIATQTKQVLENLQAVLENSGSSLEQVLKTTVYLIDMAEFAQMNGVYGLYFTENPPARATVEVSRLPKDVLVEIDCIASLL